VATYTERVLSLYSGGGGLDIGFRMAIPNARTVCYVEREISSVAVLVKGIQNKFLDDAPIWSDSSTFDSAAWTGKVDWIIGGFPCQPFSVAGKQKGTEDKRWLWDDISKFIRTIRPKGIFLENVSGLITGHGIDIVLGSLSEMGYDARWGSVQAANVGATHKRERVFILGHAKGIRFSKAEGINKWRERQSYIRNEVWNFPRATGNTKLDDTEHNGWAATEKQRGNEQTISGSQEGEDSTIQSEGTDNTSVTQQGLENSNDSRFHRTQPDGAEREREKETEERENRSLSRTRGSSKVNELGNTTSKRLQDRCEPRINDKEGWQSQERQRRKSRQDVIGIYPPGPGSGQWADIIGQYPELSPALEKSTFKSDVRGMANGVASGLHRVDRLRILGNGVVPLQAAYALRKLIETIEK